MVKILTIIILGVVLYRLLFPAPRIEKPNRKHKDEEYTDYEELD